VTKLGALLLLPLLAGCADRHAQSEAALDTTSSHRPATPVASADTVRDQADTIVTPLTDDSVLEVLHDACGSEQALRSRLGDPITRSAAPTTNIHTDATDSIIAVEYAGVAARYYRIIEEQRDLLLDLDVRSPSLALSRGLTVGDSASLVLHVLGPPKYTDEAGFSYTFGEMYETTLRVTLQRGRIAAMRWELPID